MSETNQSDPEPKPIPWQIAAVAQYGIGTLGLLLPFGFDRPSSLGLDYSHFLVLFGLFCLVSLLGLVATVSQKAWGGLIVVLVGFPVFLVLMILR